MAQELALRTPRQSTWAIRLGWLAVVLAAVFYCGMRLHDGTALQTNLLSLLPATEADPVAEKAVDTLAASLGDRTVFLVSSRDAMHAKAAAMQLGAQLTHSAAFRNVIAELPPFDTSQITRFYQPYRFGLLNTADRAALDNGATALPALLAQRLYAPVETGLSTPLADDPFGWLSHWLADLPLASTRLELEDNFLIARHDDTTSVLVTTTLAASAYDAQTQADVRAAVAQAEQSLARTFPDVTLVRTGAVFYAVAARSASEQELHRIGIVSTVGIALLMLWVFRSPRFLLLGFVSTGIGIVFALTATLLVFGKLHLLTLVFGASLIGEAVDYSIQYFVSHLGAEANQDARRSARDVRPALLVALTTSLLGYAILVGVPFPALRQIACFAIAGIGAAFLSVVSLLPALLMHAPRQPRRSYGRAARWLGRWQTSLQAALSRRGAWLLLALVAAAAGPGGLRVTSDDDIHLLIQRDPELARQEAVVREAIGVDNSTQFFVVKGDSAEQVLQRAEALQHKLEVPIAGAPLKGVQSVAQFVPSARQQAEDRARLTRRVFAEPQALRATLTEAGFRPDVATNYIHAFEGTSSGPLTVDAWLAKPWSQPYRHLWLGRVASADAPPVFAAIVIPTGATAAQLPALAALADAGIRFVDKPASVARLFATYRVDSGWWLAGALTLILVLFCVRYGLAAGVRVTLPVVCAVGITFAVYGYAGIPLNLFHWLALMLVLGVGANYAVFLREGCARHHADIGGVWVGVLLSAATTLLSFGLLGTSAMPVLRSFGMTLALGIVIAVALAPLGMPLGMPLTRHRSS